MCLMKIDNEDDLIVITNAREIIIQTITEENRYNALIEQGIEPLIAEGIVKGLWYINLVSSKGRKHF